MTKARPQQPSGEALRQPGSPKMACGEDVDACELLLAELQARRARLQRLLRLVWLDAEGLTARRGPVRSRGRCRNGRIERFG